MLGGFVSQNYIGLKKWIVWFECNEFKIKFITTDYKSIKKLQPLMIVVLYFKLGKNHKATYQNKLPDLLIFFNALASHFYAFLIVLLNL